MRITYIVHARFPVEKAYGLQIAAVCKAMSEIGHDVTIVAPHTKNYILEPVHEYYGLPGSVKFVRLNNFDALGKWWIPGPLWMIITMFFYKRKLNKFLKNNQAEALYIRSPLVLQPAIESGIPVILELHTIPKKFKSKFVSLCNKCKKVVCLTSPMRDEVRKLGVDESKLVVEGDGVDFDEFQNLPEVSNGIPVIGYVGSLATQDKIEKGVPELLRGLKVLKDRGKNVGGWIVGGPDDWKKAYSQLAESLGLSDDVKFEGRIERSEVPAAISECDVCVYPAPATDHPFIMRDTSPLKLVEYMAAGKPIVCADIPPVRDLVDETQVEFCVPGDSKSMADAIERALESSSKPQLAQEKAKKLDWKERMKRIVVPL